MKIIDLLNKIANGEEVPKKIKYGETEYIANNCVYEDSNGNLLLSRIRYISQLTDEVEILEEENKLPENNFNYIYSCEDEHIMANFENIKTTLKDIIDYLESKEKGNE